MQMRPMRLDVEENVKIGTRFTTFEHIEVSQLIVVKRKMELENNFKRKILKWFGKILRERPVRYQQLEHY